MSLKIRYKVYLFLSMALCAGGVGMNFITGNTSGIGLLLIIAGGIVLALGVTIKRKANATQNFSDNDLSSQE